MMAIGFADFFQVIGTQASLGRGGTAEIANLP